MLVVNNLQYGDLSTIRPEMRDAPSPPTSVVAIGFFDGVHRGHQSIIETACSRARRTGALARIVTFRDHPSHFFHPRRAFRYLTTIEEKLSILQRLGVDVVHLIPFDENIAHMEAEEFCYNVLVTQLRAQALIVGHDFALGKDRKGTIPVLRRYGKKMGFRIFEVAPVEFGEGQPISSTSIRELVKRGRVEQARTAMGHPYTLAGQVIKGEGRGQKLGFPTLNIQWPEEKLLPAAGVYLTWACLGGKQHPALTNIGYRPTFGGATLSVETYLLRGMPANCRRPRSLQLEFLQRLRPEKRFPSVTEMCQQIRKDTEQAEKYFVQIGKEREDCNEDR